MVGHPTMDVQLNPLNNGGSSSRKYQLLEPDNLYPPTRSTSPDIPRDSSTSAPDEKSRGFPPNEASRSNTSLSTKSYPRIPGINIGQYQKTKFWGFRGLFWRIILTPTLLGLLIALGWAVYQRPIILSSESDPDTMPILKGLWTTFLIIYLFIALIPLNDTVADVKSEEFFRLVAVPGRKGVGKPLKVINEISSLSYGIIDQGKLIFHGYATRYLVIALLVAIFGLTIGAAGPGMLNIGDAFFDTNIYALQVGAIHQESIVNATAIGAPVIGYPYNQNFTRGSMLAWAKTSFGIDYSYSLPPYSLVPLPVNLSAKDRVKYLSDVGILDPVCSFRDIQLESEFQNMFNDTMYNVTLGNDIRITFTGSRLFAGIVVSAFDEVIDITTNDINSHGHTVLVLHKPRIADNIDFSGIPTIPTRGSNESISSGSSMRYTNGEYETAILVCEPNVKVETRLIYSDGFGSLSFIGDKVYRKRGNLHPQQLRMMLTRAMEGLADESGPITPLSEEFGIANPEGLVNVIYGPNSQTVASVTNLSSLSPMNISQIEQKYYESLNAITKGLLDGKLVASDYVPARVIQSGPALTSALPQLVLSTVLWFLLVILLSYTYFRPPGRPFVFTTIASSLAGSNVPEAVAKYDIATDDIWTTSANKNILKNVGKRQLYFDADSNLEQLDHLVRTNGVQPSKGVIRMRFHDE